ncbi:MAG TPA: hypothetical protein VNA87_07045 [Actinomycetota bacterium]|nr:hypothetical protein [Actinomycetota bacterium]
MFKRIAVSVGAMALVGFMALPALAAPSDKDGDADSFASTHYTEDTDTNDGADANVDETTDNMHPSGKDRSVENGKSGNQGRSESNPDDTNGPRRYEGAVGEADKPQGLGGEDLADQDGNNGCGNDDDFDDDNNGWCGKPAAAGSTDTPPITGGGSNLGGSNLGGTQILGGGQSRGGSSTLVLASNGFVTEVLGVSFSRSPKSTAVLGVQYERGQNLARTGTDSTPAMLLLAGTFLVIGLGALKAGRRNA